MMLQLGLLKKVCQADRIDFLIWIISFGSVLCFGIIFGFVFGFGAVIVGIVYRASKNDI